MTSRAARTVLAATLASALALGGCRFAAPDPAAPVADRLYLRDHGSVRPDALPGPAAELLLAGTPVEVKVRHERSAGDELIVRLESHGEAVERERYRSDRRGFALREAGGEAYDPPLPLLRFPMEAPDEWTWKGRIGAEGAPRRSADAQVAARPETANVPGGPYPAVRVDVDLRIDGDGGPDVARRLTWWIAPGAGIVRREFGTGSSRTVRPDGGAGAP